jgi:2-polyprenyl-3-methyl-5-hydroxy-6-metoxy-1,4-benzoquinol methylase
MFDEKVVIERMHFYWRMTESSSALNPFPSFLPVELAFEKTEGILKLKTNDQFWSLLNDMYTMEENVGYLQQGHDLAVPYGSDFVSFILKNVNHGQKICDIGAGGLYVLNQLKKKQFKTLAVDPSTESIINGEEIGIEVISNFYEAVDLKKEKVDVFIHYDVLEHIRYPELFLKKHYEELPENGKIVFAVPDCTKAINNGDISMILAQHINYFDANSLANMVSRAGFEIEEILPSSFGGVLYCAAKKKKYGVIANKNRTAPIQSSIYLQFFQKQRQKQEIFEQLLDQAVEKNNCLGLYIPLRVFPYLSRYIDYSNFVFIDDSINFQGKYFDGFNFKVKGINEAAEEVDKMIIFSPSFGGSIRDKLAKQQKFKGEIISWDYE